MKNLEQYKRVVRISACLLLFIMEMFMYQYVWSVYFNHLMQIPYYRLGNWMMFGLYGVVLMVFSYIYGGFNVGVSKAFNLIYSHVLIVLFTNIVMYIAQVLVIKKMHTIFPLVIMMLVEIIVISIWSVIVTRIYQSIYPPRKVLLIFGARPIVSLMDKLHTRTDRFVIGETISVFEELSFIKKQIDRYEGVIIGDVPTEQRNKILKYCYGKSIRTYTIPKISDVIMRNSECLHIFDTPLFLSRNSGLNIEQLIVKRIMDIVISLIGLIVLSPVILITAMLIKYYDHGPAFFGQMRCTKDGKEFKIYKFRSMVVDAERTSGVTLALDKDPRITPIGQVIRKLRIDELPQLINILKGDMSLVGPRPERIELVEKYSEETPEFRYRLKVKGGLTGYAQVYGKYNTNVYDKLKLDLMYIENYSLLLDVEILFKTVKILFMKESTEGIHEDNLTIMKDQSSLIKDDQNNE